MLAIARALMGRPKLLLLDEPSLGLAPLIVKQIFAVIRELNASQGLTVFLVEQNAYPRAVPRPSRLCHGQWRHHHDAEPARTCWRKEGSARRLS